MNTILFRLSRRPTFENPITSCLAGARSSPSQPFIRRITARHISSTPKARQDVAPTMEQLRAPFYRQNSSTL